MNPSGPSRLTVWLFAVFVGAFGVWLGSGVMTNIADWPRVSYGEALGIQFCLQVVVHMLLVGLGAFTSQND